MRKFDIVIQIMKMRSAVPPLEKAVAKELSYVLHNRALKLENWDDDIPISMAEGIAKHVGAVKGKLTMADVVRDMDLLLKRASSAATA